MPTIIAFIVVTCIGLALNDFVGLIQADSIYFWKNSESKAKEVTTLLENRKVINIPQKKIFESLNGEFDSVSDVKQTKKLKKQLIGSTVEWVLRVEEVRKFGSRYQVISKNESPSSNEYEEMGKNFAKYLFGSKDKGSVISMCGTSYVYPQSPEVENKLDNLKEGDIIRVRGIVDRFEWQSDPFGILQTFSNLLWVTNSEKDNVKVFNCPVLSKAILTQNQEGKKYSVYSKETQDILNRGNAIINGFKEGFQKNSDTKNLDNQPKNVEQEISEQPISNNLASGMFICNTKKHRIIVAKQAENVYRYRSWNLPKTVTDKPDMEILQEGELSALGSGVCRHNEFTFNTGNAKITIDDSTCTEADAPKNVVGSLWIYVNGVYKNDYWCTN
jgi:hypothetical protein